MLQSTTKYCVSRCKVQGNEQQFWRSHVGTSAIVTSSPPKSPIPPAAYPLFGFIALVTRFGSLLTFLLRLRCHCQLSPTPPLLPFHSLSDRWTNRCCRHQHEATWFRLLAPGLSCELRTTFRNDGCIAFAWTKLLETSLRTSPPVVTR